MYNVNYASCGFYPLLSERKLLKYPIIIKAWCKFLYSYDMTVENDKVSFKFMFVLNEVLLATTIIVSEFWKFWKIIVIGERWKLVSFGVSLFLWSLCQGSGSTSWSISIFSSKIQDSVEICQAVWKYGERSKNYQNVCVKRAMNDKFYEYSYY